MALAAEIADGWLPVFFSPQRMQVYRESLEEGFARAAERKSRFTFDIAPIVHIHLGDDLDTCRNAIKPTLALYIGGMGARGRNFYFDLACRYGYEAAASKIQDLYLQGKKTEAVAEVPDFLVDEVALCGTRERIADRRDAWRESGVTTLICTTSSLDAVRLMAELVL